MRKLKINKRHKAARELMKENKGNPSLKGAQFDEEGCQYLGTTYYFVKIFPEYALRGVPSAKGEVMNLPKLADDFFSGMERSSLTAVRVTLNELNEQAARLEKEQVNEQDDDSIPEPFALRIREWIFNPAYVVRCMEILGANEAKLEFNNDRRHSLIAIHADKGCGAVAPFNKDKLNVNKFEEYVPLSLRG